VNGNGKELCRLKKIVNSLHIQTEIEEVNVNDDATYNIKHTPAIIIDNIVISGMNKMTVNDLEIVFKQFIEA
jgi:TATA-box binding protein (TBP) (component of TFIID and TFIIIB)